MIRLLQVLALAAIMLAIPSQAQDQVYTFAQLSATGQTTPLNLVGAAASNPGAVVNAPSNHMVWAAVTGSPATCTFKIYGSLKLTTQSPAFPQDYFELSPDQDCTSPNLAGVSSVARPAVTLLISLTALSGGTAPKVTFYYIGKR